MSIAEELRKAGTTLNELASVAQKDLESAEYWLPYNKETAWRDGFINGFGGVCSDLVAEFTPSVAMLIADLLEMGARFVGIHESMAGYPVEEADLDMMNRRLLDLAREINGAQA